jgi:hypothetical protein
MNALAMLNNRITGLGQRERDKYLEHTIAIDFISRLTVCLIEIHLP